MRQLSFLPQADKKNTLNVKVSLLKDGSWVATINDGWWLAGDKSKDKAIKKVIQYFTRGA